MRRGRRKVRTGEERVTVTEVKWGLEVWTK